MSIFNHGDRSTLITENGSFQDVHKGSTVLDHTSIESHVCVKQHSNAMDWWKSAPASLQGGSLGLGVLSRSDSQLLVDEASIVSELAMDFELIFVVGPKNPCGLWGTEGYQNVIAPRPSVATYVQQAPPMLGRVAAVLLGSSRLRSWRGNGRFGICCHFGLKVLLGMMRIIIY